MDQIDEILDDYSGRDRPGTLSKLIALGMDEHEAAGSLDEIEQNIREERQAYADDCDDDRMMFADPGGNSALRAASEDNPRNLPCPTCHQPNRLTPADVALGYQCDSCADALERGGP